MKLADAFLSYFGDSSNKQTPVKPTNTKDASLDDFKSLFDYTNTIYNQPVPSTTPTPGSFGTPSSQMLASGPQSQTISNTQSQTARPLVAPLWSGTQQNQQAQQEPSTQMPYQQAPPYIKPEQQQGNSAGILGAILKILAA